MLFSIFAVMALISVVLEQFEDLKFHRLTPGEHYGLALSACGVSVVTQATTCAIPNEAKRQLDAIPLSARESAQSIELLSAIKAQETRAAAESEKWAATYRKQAYERFQANMAGEAHDPFTCAMSTESKPIMSFNGGTNWWVDDGRCRTQLQKTKDADAKISSYSATPIRVVTDMDSFWLPDEQRVCETYPDDMGQVAVVACTTTGTHKDHNIPVKFWGGVDRNTVSSWRCRREKSLFSDEFVCRAVN